MKTLISMLITNALVICAVNASDLPLGHTLKTDPMKHETSSPIAKPLTPQEVRRMEEVTNNLLTSANSLLWMSKIDIERKIDKNNLETSAYAIFPANKTEDEINVWYESLEFLIGDLNKIIEYMKARDESKQQEILDILNKSNILEIYRLLERYLDPVQLAWLNEKMKPNEVHPLAILRKNERLREAIETMGKNAGLITD